LTSGILAPTAAKDCHFKLIDVQLIMEVVLEKKAAKYLERLNEPMKSRIITALDGLADEPPHGDINKLQGQEAAYRLRVGSYRILFKDKISCIAVYKIAPRGQAYKET